MAYVKFEHNGQGYYEFVEMVEEKTDKGFAKIITDHLSVLNELEQTDFEVICQFENEQIPTVFIKRTNRVKIFRHYGKDNYELLTIFKNDIELLEGMFK